MNNIIPCPFCGNKIAPKVMSIANIEGTVDNEWNESHYAVICDWNDDVTPGCGASTGYHNESPEKAIETWNRRAES